MYDAGDSGGHTHSNQYRAAGHYSNYTASVSPSSSSSLFIGFGTIALLSPPSHSSVESLPAPWIGVPLVVVVVVVAGGALLVVVGWWCRAGAVHLAGGCLLAGARGEGGKWVGKVPRERRECLFARFTLLCMAPDEHPSSNDDHRGVDRR